MRVFGERKEDEATGLEKAVEGLGERRPIVAALPALDEGILPSLSLFGTSDMLSLVCGLRPPPPPPAC
ncbi:uncharacterized protein STEHIDRAFT_122762 [Stereum hirsutum FP-91666 SS1]|uniref:uncharacterized protein n=1 Tax=Stereum hirsutum (strain FP-91666) TaxID=721885 RepID=UPI000444A7C3|nr:uncharacterized protein STEHIDRAFT_122762 [Stereum hirsutum FP-91666 SS1]EIM84808.1 hypothetical protein STEHIDRAFT_122762 [Stereum hirsutum FP-91666 SS1]